MEPHVDCAMFDMTRKDMSSDETLEHDTDSVGTPGLDVVDWYTDRVDEMRSGAIRAGVPELDFEPSGGKESNDDVEPVGGRSGDDDVELLVNEVSEDRPPDDEKAVCEDLGGEPSCGAEEPSAGERAHDDGRTCRKRRRRFGT